MKATAKAPANIAFIKYWGKADASLRLPANSSFSMNLSDAYTTTTVEFSHAYKNDRAEMLSSLTSNNIQRQQELVEMGDNETKRITEHLNLIRNRTGISDYARVVTQNSFPKGAGIASSASGFAALTMAAVVAASACYSEKDLSILARLGSGSACRSIPGGFVLWEKGHSSDTSFARSVFPHDYWDIRDIVLIVDPGMKKVPSVDGHALVATSPVWADRLSGMEEKIRNILYACQKKDFKKFGTILEEDCLSMHGVMQSQTPPLRYWNPTTVRIMDVVRGWRRQGISAYFTIDAGPNVHVICLEHDEKFVSENGKNISGVQSVMVNKSAPGAQIITNHLF